MKKNIDISTYFKMDRSVVKQFNSFEEADSLNDSWLDRPVEERYYAIEFLRAQWIEMNNLSQTMDRQYFEYR